MGLLQHANLRWWLVEHPTISSFQWAENQTWVSSPQFLLTALLSYLSLNFLLHLILPKTPTYSAPPPSSSPSVLRIISAVHNLFLLLISLAMAVDCSLSSSSHWFVDRLQQTEKEAGDPAMGGRRLDQARAMGRWMAGDNGWDRVHEMQVMAGLGGDGRWGDGWQLAGRWRGRDSGGLGRRTATRERTQRRRVGD
ncbi:hypothetical protein ACLOJK_014212 [Asimina triloba]